MEKPVPLDKFVEETEKAKPDPYLPDAVAGVKASGRGIPRDADPRAFAEFQILQMKDFLLEMYKGTSAAHTFLDTAGGVVDCMPRERQPSALAAAKHKHVLRKAPAGRRAKNAKTPLGPGKKDPNGTSQDCPDGTIPWKRVTLDALAKLGNLEDFFVHRKSEGDQAGDGPGGRGQWHGGYYHRYATVGSSGGPFYGCQGWFNLWAPNPSPGVFSLSQLWLVRNLAGWGSGVQTIESGWQVYPGHPHDPSRSGLPYLFVFFNPDNYGTRSGYLVNTQGEGFIYYDNPGWTIGSPLPANMITQSAGSDQYGVMMRWAGYDNGDWELWIGVDENELQAVGYLPGGLYGSTGSARPFERLDFGGEVSSQTNQTATGPMGTRFRPTGDNATDFGRCAFIKAMAAQYGSGQEYRGVGDFQVKDTQDTPNYACGLGQTEDWGTYMFFGGPN